MPAGAALVPLRQHEGGGARDRGGARHAFDLHDVDVDCVAALVLVVCAGACALYLGTRALVIIVRALVVVVRVRVRAGAGAGAVGALTLVLGIGPGAGGRGPGGAHAPRDRRLLHARWRRRGRGRALRGECVGKLRRVAQARPPAAVRRARQRLHAHAAKVGDEYKFKVDSAWIEGPTEVVRAAETG
jgi:hypothetical protein